MELTQPALKWLQVASVPRALTLHLKRFRSTGRRVHKIDEHVPFPATLDLSALMSPAGKPATHFTAMDSGGGKSGGTGGGAAAVEAAGASMRLYGVIEHEGSFQGGHYVAYVRLAERWFRMNDSSVMEVDEAEALSKQAFMLFYERAAPAAA